MVYAILLPVNKVCRHINLIWLHIWSREEVIWMNIHYEVVYEDKKDEKQKTTTKVGEKIFKIGVLVAYLFVIAIIGCYYVALSK